MPSFGKILMWCIVPAALSFLFYRRNYFVGDTGYGFQTTADEIAAGLDLSDAGRHTSALVTGATGGLGFETARVLASRGAHVFVCGRTAAKAQKAVAAIEKAVGKGVGVLTPVACALGSLADVQSCADAVTLLKKPLDLLVLNAGIAWLTKPTTTPDGFETTMGVNHLAHFHLTSLLLPRMLTKYSRSNGVYESPPRVVVLSSSAHGMSSADSMADASLGMQALLDGTRSWLVGAPAYGDTKLANALFARELHNRYSAQGLLTFSVDPGEIMTGIVKDDGDAWFTWLLLKGGKLLEPLMLKTPAQGAATQTYCALLAPASQSGGFFRNSNAAVLDTAPLRALLDDAGATKRFWETSEKLVNAALKKD